MVVGGEVVTARAVRTWLLETGKTGLPLAILRGEESLVS